MKLLSEWNYGVLWKSIPDKDTHNPDRFKTDPGSYTRKTLRRVTDEEEPNWWRDYISEQKRIELQEQHRGNK